MVSGRGCVVSQQTRAGRSDGWFSVRSGGGETGSFTQERVVSLCSSPSRRFSAARLRPCDGQGCVSLSGTCDMPVSVLCRPPVVNFAAGCQGAVGVDVVMSGGSWAMMVRCGGVGRVCQGSLSSSTQGKATRKLRALRVISQPASQIGSGWSLSQSNGARERHVGRKITTPALLHADLQSILLQEHGDHSSCHLLIPQPLPRLIM